MSFLLVFCSLNRTFVAMKKIFFHLCAFAGFMLSALSVQAQQMVARQFPFMEQLYSNEIFDVLPSDDGFLWVGTTQGLAVWDGFRLRNLRTDHLHPGLLSDNNIRLMAETATTAWFTTHRGVTLYDKKQGSFRQIKDERIAGKSVGGITKTNEDEVWIAVGHRLYRCSGKGDVLEEVNPFAKAGTQEEDFIYLAADNSQNLWILCRHNTLLCRQKKSGKIRRMPALPGTVSAFTIYQDREGRYWIGTWGNGLWQMFPDKTSSEECYQRQTIRNSSTGQEERIVFNMVQDGHHGLLWALTYSGLYALSCEEGKLQTVDISSVIDPHKMYTILRRDPQGNIWIGAYDMGYTIYFDKSGIKSDGLPQLKKKLGWDVNLYNLCADGRYVWMNQDRVGVLLYDRQRKAFASLESLTGEVSILRKSISEHHVWTGTRVHPILMNLSHDDMTIRKEQEIDLRQHIGNVGRLVDMAEDKEGNLWILTTKGLLARPAGKEVLLTCQQAYDSAKAIVLDKKGLTLWCAVGSAVMQCDCSYNIINTTEKGRFDRLTPDEHATHLAQDNTGRLWITTSSGRLLRSDNNLRNFIQQPLDTLLTNGPILDMTIANDLVWLMTAHQVICYQIQNGLTRLYPAAQGSVGVTRFLDQSLSADGNGGILAGGLGGFVHFPSQTVPEAVERKARVSDVLIDGHSLFYGLENGNQLFNKVVLPPDAHDINIRFSLIPLSLTRNPLQYRLKGVDSDWRLADSSHPEAFYNRLQRGTYQMEVRICQPNGSWGKPVELLTIVRKPAWWETWWAFTLYALLAIGTVVLLLLLNHRRHKKELYVEVTQTKMSMLTADHSLLDKIVAVIDSHLDDSDFGLDELASEMNMSKSTLHRRLKASADMTPLDFIRSIRIKRAADMLLAGEKNISEVAYSTGFTTPKYFTRCFKEEFGMTPTQYQQKKV